MNRWISQETFRLITLLAIINLIYYIFMERTRALKTVCRAITKLRGWKDKLAILAYEALMIFDNYVFLTAAYSALCFIFGGWEDKQLGIIVILSALLILVVIQKIERKFGQKLFLLKLRVEEAAQKPKKRRGRFGVIPV
ncbi:membrane hypothetical protein [uncultured Desulfatiglans sp.]|nr:membrane hypothetical protein [uncultured Desulfatiglans sp.]